VVCVLHDMATCCVLHDMATYCVLHDMATYCVLYDMATYCVHNVSLFTLPTELSNLMSTYGRDILTNTFVTLKHTAEVTFRNLVQCIDL
jgi:hypothetical protein